MENVKRLVVQDGGHQPGGQDTPKGRKVNPGDDKLVKKISELFYCGRLSCSRLVCHFFDSGGKSLADLGRPARHGEVREVTLMTCWRCAGLQKMQ